MGTTITSTVAVAVLAGATFLIGSNISGVEVPTERVQVASISGSGGVLASAK